MEVETITISRPGMTMLSGPSHPTDLIGMAHSPAYFAAAGVADRVVSWEHASEGKIGDPAIHWLIDCVRVGEPPIDVSYRQGATVTIRTHDGREISDTVHVPKGAAAIGISWGDVDCKYRTLVSRAGLHQSKIEASRELVHDFRHIGAVAPFIRLLEID
jgi:2-methylcitrate dehydratase PrpD